MKNFTSLCKKAALMLSLVLSGYASQAQTQIFLEKMGAVTANTDVDVHETANGFDNDNLTMTTDGAPAANTTSVRKSNSKGTDGTDDANIWMATAGDRFFAIEGIDASGYTNLLLEFAYRKEQAGSLPVIELAYWNGTAYVPVTYTFAEAATATAGWYTVSGIQLPVAAQINGLKLRWKKTAASVETRLDEVKLTGTVAAPAVAPTIASTLNGRAAVKTTVQENFAVSTTTGTSAGQLVKVKMALATPAQAADITLLYEATPGNFLPLPFNAAGEVEFGPATGFPLANTATNFKVTFAAAGTYNYTLAIIDATTGVALAAPTAESVTVAAFVNPTIASTLNGRTGVVTGVQETYNVTTVAGDMAGIMVKVKATLATPAQAANIALEYFETSNSTWTPIAFDANGVLMFGPPATGFPLANATSNFRVTYNAAGTYATTLEIVNAATGVAIVPGVTESVTVAAPTVAPTIASTLNNRANVLTTVEESFSVTNTTGSMANQLVRVKLQLANAAQAANIALTYEATPGNFLPLTFDAAGIAMFGPAAGFPLTNATTNFKITFSAAGTYNYTLAIVDAATNVNLAPATSESVTAAAFVNPTIASTLNGRTGVKASVEEAFAVSTTTGSSAGQLVKVKMALVTPAQAANITLLYEATPGNFLPLTFNAAGEVEFGPATGFPLANLATNFKATFAAAGTYDYTLAIIDAATGAALAAPTAESVTVAALVNAAIASDLNGRTGIVTRTQNDFEVGVIAGDMAGKIVNIKLTLANPAQAASLELFYEDATGNYLPLTFNTNGGLLFGPVSGFPLADDTTAFRITFNNPGTYNYSIAILEASTGDTLAISSESVSILVNGVNDAQLARLVKVYPNPATDVLNLELSNNLKADVAVLDLTGKQVAALNNVSGSPKLNVADLNAGTYLLQIKTAEGVAVKRFVVVR